MSDSEIERLVEQAREGDAAAFGALYDAFAPRVYRFFRFRVSTPESAEDLTQRVFLKMIEQLPHYRNQGVPFAAWLFRVARNAWIDEHRTSHSAMPLELLSDSAADEASPEQRAIDAYDWDVVRRALHRLPDDQREVIACRFFADLSARETAAQMGRSEGSVRVLQHRALAALRRLMAGRVAARGTPSDREEGVP
jgi:RNA polymerase sigma-70 factor (ECF subfamily)